MSWDLVPMVVWVQKAWGSVSWDLDPIDSWNSWNTHTEQDFWEQYHTPPCQPFGLGCTTGNYCQWNHHWTRIPRHHVDNFETFNF